MPTVGGRKGTRGGRTTGKEDSWRRLFEAHPKVSRPYQFIEFVPFYKHLTIKSGQSIPVAGSNDCSIKFPILVVSISHFANFSRNFITKSYTKAPLFSLNFKNFSRMIKIKKN